MSQHVLFFPARVTEPIALHNFHSDKRTVIQALLEEHGDGAYVEFEIKIDGEFSGKLAYLATDDRGVARNPRAEEAVAFLTGGAHFAITGDACLVNIPAELVEYVGSGAFR